MLDGVSFNLAPTDVEHTCRPFDPKKSLLSTYLQNCILIFSSKKYNKATKSLFIKGYNWKPSNCPATVWLYKS